MNRFLPRAGLAIVLPVIGLVGLARVAAAETLISTELERVADTEVRLQRVTFPADTALPKHWHPGEEFAYVIDGSITLMLDGAEPLEMTSGEAVKIPAHSLHSARAGAAGVELVIFRVHEAGQPERILVEDR